MNSDLAMSSPMSRHVDGEGEGRCGLAIQILYRTDCKVHDRFAASHMKTASQTSAENSALVSFFEQCWVRINLD